MFFVTITICETLTGLQALDLRRAHHLFDDTKLCVYANATITVSEAFARRHFLAHEVKVYRNLSLHSLPIGVLEATDPLSNYAFFKSNVPADLQAQMLALAFPEDVAETVDQG